MAAAEGHGGGCAGKIDRGVGVVGAFKGFAKRVDLLGSEGLEFVDCLAYLTLLIGGYGAEVGHQFVDQAFLAEIFYTQFLGLGLAGGCKAFDFLLEGVNSVNHVGKF